MTAEDDIVLRDAAIALESKGFVTRVTDLTGEPIAKLLRSLPAPVSNQVNKAVKRALAQSLDLALSRMDTPGGREPAPAFFKVASGVTGGVSGLFGLAALAIELPITTTLMLRSIAGIAKTAGEDLSQPEARLACLEVLAFGPKGRHDLSGETSYYAARAFLAKTLSKGSAGLIERVVTRSTTPLLADFLASIASRFGVVVSEKVAAGAIPIVGALGGAGINLIFMDHFQQLAKAHFAIRRLERNYGMEAVQSRYKAYANVVTA